MSHYETNSDDNNPYKSPSSNIGLEKKRDSNPKSALSLLVRWTVLVFMSSLIALVILRIIMTVRYYYLD
jgi:hypothetical protein